MNTVKPWLVRSPMSGPAFAGSLRRTRGTASAHRSRSGGRGFSVSGGSCVTRSSAGSVVCTGRATDAGWPRPRPLSLLVAGDQPHRPVVEEVIPRPVDQDEHPVAEADQLNEVDEEPHNPRRKAGEAEPPELGNRGVPPDGGHGATVTVHKPNQGLTGDLPSQILGDRFSLLDRYWCDHGKGRAVRSELGQIADGVDVREALDLKGRAHLDPSIRRSRKRGGTR